MSSLRKDLIRLAHMRPELRPHLLPLLAKQAVAKSPAAWLKAEGVTDEKVEDFVVGDFYSDIHSALTAEMKKGVDCVLDTGDGTQAVHGHMRTWDLILPKQMTGFFDVTVDIAPFVKELESRASKKGLRIDLSERVLQGFVRDLQSYVIDQDEYKVILDSKSKKELTSMGVEDFPDYEFDAGDSDDPSPWARVDADSVTATFRSLEITGTKMVVTFDATASVQGGVK